MALHTFLVEAESSLWAFKAVVCAANEEEAVELFLDAAMLPSEMGEWCASLPYGAEDAALGDIESTVSVEQVRDPCYEDEPCVVDFVREPAPQN